MLTRWIHNKPAWPWWLSLYKY